jgi:hypothetical protein
MPALLALIPFKDWCYAALIAALIAFGMYEVHHLKAEGAAHEIAALQKSSVQLQTKAAAEVKATADNYAGSLAKIKGDLDEQITIAVAQHGTDAQRLRDYDAYRRSHPALVSAASGRTTPDAGAGSTISVDDVLTGMEQAGLGLANANRLAGAALTACTNERNSLTGK